MNDLERARRRFIKGGVALASLPFAGIPLALGQAVQSGSFSAPVTDPNKLKLKGYGERSRFDTLKRTESPGEGGMDHKDHKTPYGLVKPLDCPLQDLVGIITPNSLHFISSHEGFYVPDINPDEHRLMIHGMVDHPMVLTMDEIKRFPSISRVHYLECMANDPKPRHKTAQDAAGKTSCAEWTGVPLALLLQQVGVQSGAKWLVAEAADDNHATICIPLAKAMSEYSMVAYGQNGEPVRPQNGYPLRLLVPGLEGLNSIKWLRRLKVTDEFYMTYNDYSRYTSVDPSVVKLNSVQGPKSVITSPSGGQQLPAPGHYEITGLAWSGNGVVSRVEISTDGGQTWKDSEFRSPVYKMAHTRFGLPWEWEGQEHMLMSRCTDETGAVQMTLEAFNKYWSEPGTNDEAHKNFIMPWKLGKDGKVENGLA